MITFKNVPALDDWAGLSAKNPILRELVLWLHDEVWPSAHDFVITRIAERDANQRTEIHTDGNYRAVDLRTSNLPDMTAQRIEKKINETWDYDPARPGKRVALWHDAGSGNHLHIQTHSNTRRRA